MDRDISSAPSINQTPTPWCPSPAGTPYLVEVPSPAGTPYLVEVPRAFQSLNANQR